MHHLAPSRRFPVRLALAAALVLPTFAAQDDAPRATKQLLHLSDGRVLRVKARQVGETWEVQGRGGWQALPAGLVERARSEREVLAQSRDLAKDAGRDEATKRVALADWMLREGLTREALEELDGVLTRSPDEPSAVALLAAPPQPLRIGGLDSEDVDDVVRAAAQGTPAVRELALHRLAELEDDTALEARLTQALVASSPRVRAFAALGLRRLFPGKAVEPLLVRSVLDGSDEVRLGAALALGAVGDQAMVLPIARALESENASVRMHAVETLGAMGYPAAVPVLVSHLAALQSGGGEARAPRNHIFVGRQFAFVQDYDVEVAQFAAVADPQINTLTEGAVLDVRVIGVTQISATVEAARTRQALASLVGEEKSSRGWLAWWDANKGDFLGGAAEASTTQGG